MPSDPSVFIIEASWFLVTTAGLPADGFRFENIHVGGIIRLHLDRELQSHTINNLLDIAERHAVILEIQPTLYPSQPA